MKTRNAMIYAAMACMVAGSLWAAPKPQPEDDGITTDTFSCKGKRCENQGNWTFSVTTDSIVKETGHGKPRFFLNMNDDEFIPWVQNDMGGDTPFHGDYRGDEVTRLSFDARTDNSGAFCGTEGRLMSVEIRDDGGTPDNESDDCGVLINLGQIPQVGEGWIHYDLAIDSQSPTLPNGWEVSFLGGNCDFGALSGDEAWNSIITDVDQVRICWEQCDFASLLCTWDVSIDNIEIERAVN